MADPTPEIFSSTAEYYRAIPVWRAEPRQKYWLHALLLAATCFTTVIVGARMEFNFLHNLPVFSMSDPSLSWFPASWIFTHPQRLLLGIPFAATLMLILMAHEMGHYLYCKKYRVWATLPYFIPAPTFIGTLGAFIRIRSPIRSRTALFDIGIAGPIAGFVVAVVVLAFSLGLSKPMVMPPSADDLVMGVPLIFNVMHRLLAALYGPGTVASLPVSRVLLHPVAVAAWVGMFATSLNLLPGGQLDGGHIVFSLAPRIHRFISRLTILILLPMAYYLWTGWLVWAVLLYLSSFRHPQVADWPKVRGFRAGLAVFALVMLALTMTPAPFAHASVPEIVRQIRGR